MSFTTRRGVVATLLALAGCGGSGGGGGSGAERIPASAGQVWEIDHPDDQAANAGALLAFVSGLHVMVVDGNRLYTGMTRLEGTPEAGGGLEVHLTQGQTAELTPVDEGVEIRFSTGESVPMKKRIAK